MNRTTKPKIEKPEYLYRDICSRIGGGESSDVRLSVSTTTGEAQLVLTYEVRDYFPVTEYDKVIELYEKLGGSGRKWLNIEKILKAMWN